MLSRIYSWLLESVAAVIPLSLVSEGKYLRVLQVHEQWMATDAGMRAQFHELPEYLVFPAVVLQIDTVSAHRTFPNSQFLSRSEYWLLSDLLKENNLALNSLYIYM